MKGRKTFNPSVLFSSYVTFDGIDDTHVKATVTNHGISGSGIITINKEGAITEFFSDERQVENINGVDTRIGWRCTYENYAPHNGILQVSGVKCIKVYPDNTELVYFDSNQIDIELLK
jgi:hypothetical protein